MGLHNTDMQPISSFFRFLISPIFPDRDWKPFNSDTKPIHG